MSVYNLTYISYMNFHLVYDVVYVSKVFVCKNMYSRYTKRLFVYDVTIKIKSIIESVFLKFPDICVVYTFFLIYKGLFINVYNVYKLKNFYM